MVVITVTPGADGLQVHVVQPGETLITIAAAYRVNLADLLVLNGIAASAVIFPGDQLKIPREGASATTEAVERDQTPSATPTAGRTSWVLFPTWTPRPSRTPQPVVPSGVRSVILGGQNTYVRLTNTGNAFNTVCL